MKALLITHFYPPEPGAGATRVASLVTALADAGHDVTLVTSFPSFPKGRFENRKRPFVCVQTAGRVRIVRLFSLLLPGIPGARLVHWLTAAAAASLYATVVPAKYDVVIVSSPPITIAIPGLVAAWRHGAKLVVDVRDVFPDIAVAMGVWKADSIYVRAVEVLVRALYRRADLIAAVTPTAIAQIARRNVPSSRMILARNAAEKQPDRPAYSRANGFTAIYAGNLGLTTDVDVLLDAAILLAGDRISIRIVGGGAQKERLDERLRDRGIPNVDAIEAVPRDQAMAMVAAADVSIIPLKRGIEESVPTKLYDSLSVGCPVVIVGDGEAKKEGSALGAFYTPPGDAPSLAALLRQLSALDTATLRAIGAAGKSRIEERDDRAGIMRGLVARIGTLL